MVIYHFNRYLLGLISTYLCSYHHTEEFIIALKGVRIIHRPNILILAFYNDINYQLKSSIYVAIGGHCYATLIKTDIHLIVLNRLVYREIELIALTLMTSRKTREPELRMITGDFYSNNKAPF